MSREYVLQPFQAPVELRIDYAAELNAQQFAAVTALPNPALVIAGAGSGKTRTLTYRVAYLLEQGIPAGRILLLTFTNKAAREMMRRVTDVLGSDISDLWGGTFHSIGNRILRRHADRLGYRPDFSILDRDDARDLMKACLDSAEIDVKATRFPKPEVVAEILSFAVNTRTSPAEVIRQEYPHFEPLTSQIEDLGRRFSERKRSTNVMDFDDLLVLWFRLLQEQSDVCELYQRRFQFILVDEYQDTNRLQSDLIDLLAARHQNVMVVGDDSQSIYSWRGANFRNILEFPKRYEKATVYKIETNYRSTPEILAVANAAIAPNLNQFEKKLVTARKPGLKPVLIACGDGGAQAAFVAQRALELRDEGINLNEMAILYRSHFHALELQLELTRRNIPFSITSGVRFFEQAHIKDVAAYLKWVRNPDDELSFKRIIRLLRGVGSKSAEKLWNSFHEKWRSLLTAEHTEQEPNILHSRRGNEADGSPAAGDPPPHVGGYERSERSGLTPDTAPTLETDSEAKPKPPSKAPLASALQSCLAHAPKKAAVEWAQLTATVSQLEADPVRNIPAEMIELVLESGYEDYLKENFPNYRNRIEDLEQLAVFSRQFKSVDEFLSQLALLSNVDADEDKPAVDESEQIKLSSIHQAKGLEFRVVFVIMLCDGFFPSARSIDNPDTEEEERRLFYVAITRARDELYLSYPLIRTMGAYGGDVMQQPSRFLDEIPDELLDEWNLTSFNPYG